jgi:hypothetical protein
MLFPSIDLLASKLVLTDQARGSSSHNRPGITSQSRQFTSNKKENYSMARCGPVVEVHGGKTIPDRNSSQERIIEAHSSPTGASEIDLEDLDARGNAIKKTVDFKVV